MADTCSFFGEPVALDDVEPINFADSSDKDSSHFQFKAEFLKTEKVRRLKRKPWGSEKSNHGTQGWNFGVSNKLQVIKFEANDDVIANWGELPHDAMSIIVKCAKSSSEATIKKMRLVNKHWCSAVGSSVQEIECALDLYGVADRVFDLFPNLTSLTSCSTTDSGLAGINALKNLKTLRLSGPRLKSEGLARLAELTRLTELHLACPEMGCQGVRHLSKLEKLAVLDLSELPMTGNRVDHFSSLKNLVSLKLGPMKELRIAHGREKGISSLTRKRVL